jgi:hypothetical protein
MSARRFRLPSCRLALVAAALAGALVPLPAAFVERAYSSGLYLLVQPRLTAFSNHAPFALFDVAAVGVASAWAAALALDRWRRRRRWALVAARAGARTVTWVAALYLAFLVIWGLNYRRLPLQDKLQFDPAAVTPEAARTLATTAVSRLNALYDPGHAEGWPTDSRSLEHLAHLFARTEIGLGAARLATPGRPKRTIFDWYFRRAGVAGMTDPYFLETLVASDLLPLERPFVVAHEWAHLGGFAAESEANFVGWVTCLQGGPSDQYSAWISLFGDFLGAVPRRERAAILAPLGAGPRADLRAIADRLARNISPSLSTAGWEMYDRYLKANRVEMGAANYGQVVRLVLGTRFAEGWMPLRK